MDDLSHLEGNWSNALDEKIHTEIAGSLVHVTGACWASWYSAEDVENLIAKRIWRPLP